MNTKLALMGLSALMIGFGIVGCSQEAKEDMSAAGKSAANAADKAGDAVGADATKAGDAVANAADKAGAAVENAGDKAGMMMDNAKITMKVKNGILSAENLTSKGLNVDTMGKTVTLKGSVTSESSKKRAAEIAKMLAGPDFTVDNQLTVGN